MSETQLEQNIAEAITPIVEETGHSLVAVEMGQEGGMPILRVLCENPETKRINIDQCATISREVSAILDVEDFISYKYRLEVSSPGIDRPIVSAEEAAKYIDHDLRIWFSVPLANGQKKMRGIISKVEGNILSLHADDEDFEIDFGQVSKAKLVLTDKLIKETAKSFEVSNKSE